MSEQEPEAPATPRLNFGSQAAQPAQSQEQPVPVESGETSVEDTETEQPVRLTDEEALAEFNALAERQAQATVETEDTSLTGSEEIGGLGELEVVASEEAADTQEVEETPSETAIGVADDGTVFDTETGEPVEEEIPNAETIEAINDVEDGNVVQTGTVEETLADLNAEQQADPIMEVTADEVEAEANTPIPPVEAAPVVADGEDESVEVVADVEDAEEAVIDTAVEPLDNGNDVALVDPPEPEATEDASTADEAADDGAEVAEKSQAELEAEAIEKHRQQHADEATERLHSTEVGPSIEELKERQADLDKQIKAKQDAEKESVLSQIKTVVTTYGITTEDLVNYLGGYKPKRPGVKAIQKYKDPVSGATWSGRGKAPTWIKGQDYNKFLTTQP